MLVKELRAQVLEANLEIVRRGLVLYTFGNASGIDREAGLVAIKPSGVPSAFKAGQRKRAATANERPCNGAI